MAWTYDSSLPTDKDKVRALIGDTDTNDQLVTNEAITLALTKYDNVEDAAAYCCILIAAKYSRQASKTIGATSIQHQQKASAYRDLAEVLREMADDVKNVHTAAAVFASSDGVPEHVMPGIKDFDLIDFASAEDYD